MADKAAVRSGLQTMMQDHLSEKATSTIVNIMPLLYILLYKDGNKQGNINKAGATTGAYGLGRPGSGALISRVPMNKARREEVLNSDKYMPMIQALLPAEGDGKVMGQRDTMPERSDWKNNSPATYFKRPFFKWVERVDPICVPKKDIRRVKKAASNEKLASVAVGDLFKTETASVMTTQFKWWNKKFWGTDQTIGTDPSAQGPSDLDADVWDCPFSMASMCTDGTNGAITNYGGVDRTSAANAYFRGKYVTTKQPAVLSDLSNYANYKLKCAFLGSSINLFMCGATLFPRFLDECRAKGGQICYDGLPNMGEYGFEQPIGRFNNTFVVFDPECPDVLHESGSYTKNAVLGINLDTITMAIQPESNFTVDEPFDNSKIPGGDDAITSNIRTEMIIAGEAPPLNCWFEDVG